MDTNPTALRFTYTNWKGEVNERRIRPMKMVFMGNEWHPQPGWLIQGLDLDRHVIRTFAIKDMSNIREEPI